MDCSEPLHETLSDVEIVQCCNSPNRRVVGSIAEDNFVVVLSEKAVVKFGWGVTSEEVGNQRWAFERLNSGILRVPEVYRYFTDQPDENLSPVGYIVMEYIHGKVFESLNDDQVAKIGDILSHFATISGQCPGSLQQGIARGLLWQDNGEPTFKNTEQMQKWLNVRLPDVEDKLSFMKYPLVLCHMDLAPRNFVWLNDGSVCLLDWASAGFYPRFFEVSLLKIMEGNHGDYEVRLIDKLEKLTEDEETQGSLLARSFYNGIRYSFSSIDIVLDG
ncbi:kinase-like domain-containing protein [Xylogone sp. PMI_703]|nr:kinase-like domain-containing protein [Xylogone sp. PMI_703]